MPSPKSIANTPCNLQGYETDKFLFQLLQDQVTDVIHNQTDVSKKLYPSTSVLLTGVELGKVGKQVIIVSVNMEKLNPPAGQKVNLAIKFGALNTQSLKIELSLADATNKRDNWKEVTCQ